jgi:glucokinase
MLVGVDIGGTKMLAIAASLAADIDTPDAVKVDHERRVPTPKSADVMVAGIEALVRSLEADSGGGVSGVAIGIAGLVDTLGVVHYSPHLPDVHQLALAAELRKALGCPVIVENDLTTAAIAEARMGAGRGCRNFVMVALGTGVGSKYYVDGELFRGAHGFAGEAGHMTVDRDGPRHLTGQPGPWEAFASGLGLGELARAAARGGGAPRLVELAGGVEAVSGQTVAAAVAEGDAAALAVLDDFAEQVALGLGSLVNILDPERIVVGGGVSEIGEPLRARVEAALGRWIVGAAVRPPVPIVLAQLGEMAGVLGAAVRAGDAARAG